MFFEVKEKIISDLTKGNWLGVNRYLEEKREELKLLDFKDIQELFSILRKKKRELHSIGGDPVRLIIYALEKIQVIKQSVIKRCILSQETESVGAGVMICYKSKKRQGGIGPKGYLEISPWSKSLNAFLSLPVGVEFDFVFDYEKNIVGIAVSKKAAMLGHSGIRNHFGLDNVCGGSLKINERVDGEPSFGFSEFSGHFGQYWTRERRYQFISGMLLMGIKGFHRKMNPDEITKTVGDSSLYPEQLSFLRSVRGSLWNPSYPLCVFPAESSRSLFRTSSLWLECSDGSFKPKKKNMHEDVPSFDEHTFG